MLQQSYNFKIIYSLNIATMKRPNPVIHFFWAISFRLKFSDYYINWLNFPNKYGFVFSIRAVKLTQCQLRNLESMTQISTI